MTTLGQLLDAAGLTAPLTSTDAAQEVSTVELDSRQCTAGSVFVCMTGTSSSGEAYVSDALARGSICVVASSPVQAPVVVRVEPAAIRGALAALSSAAVGRPAELLTLVGVTGTNGKTSVTWLTEGILNLVGYSASAIGTLSGQRTTPSSPDLHRDLRAAADRATSAGLPGAVAMEVSSHALDQGRVEGVRFDVAVFSNLSHEHLDYHGTMEAYFEAKAALFEPASCAAAVVCVDDEWGRRLVARGSVPTRQVASREASEVASSLGHTTFQWRERRVDTRLTGEFNVTNALLALSAVEVLGVDLDESVRALSAVPSVPGRMELVGDGAPSVLVDYAHTPAALQRALADLRAIRPASRLVVVFGCGGERDAEKRPLMGSVASHGADEVVVTSDNPRGEDPVAIIDAVVAGATGPASLRRDDDRAAAITGAIERAGDDDVILVAGKGHEVTQEIGGRVVEFDDRVVASSALAARGPRC